MPHSTTSVPPCVLFLKKVLKTRLHLLHPDVKDSVMAEQVTQKSQYNQNNRSRGLYVGQRVLARNYHPGEDWILGTVIKKRGPHSYTVQVSNGQLWHQQIDQLNEMEDSPQTNVAEKSSDIDCQAYRTNQHHL